MGRLALGLCAALALAPSLVAAQQQDMVAPGENVAAVPPPDVTPPPPPPETVTPQVVEPPSPTTPPETVTPEPVTPPDAERPHAPAADQPTTSAPRFAMSADVTFGPGFPISIGGSADERLGQTFRYHVNKTLEGFYVGVTFGQILDPNAVFLQFANRFGYDLWFRIDDSISWGVDFYVALGMFFYAALPHGGGADTSFASLELENGLELKLYLSPGFYVMARPVGLAYLSPGGLGGGATFLDVSGGVGFAF